MDLSATDHTPAQPVDEREVRIAHYIIAAESVAWQARHLLVANEPKPWSARLRSLNKTLGTVIGACRQAKKEIPIGAIQAAFRWTPPPSEN